MIANSLEMIASSTAPSLASQNQLPLAIDLDGTLIWSDTNWMLAWMHCKRKLLPGLVQLGIWYWRSGRAGCKTELASRYGAKINLDQLPYSCLVKANLIPDASGTYLVSGSVQSVVTQIADHLGGFHAAYGSSETCNLTGANKAAFLQAQFPQGFGYIGNSIVDIPVWKAASFAYGFNVSHWTASRAKWAGIDLMIIPETRRNWSDYAFETELEEPDSS